MTTLTKEQRAAVSEIEKGENEWLLSMATLSEAWERVTQQPVTPEAIFAAADAIASKPRRDLFDRVRQVYVEITRGRT